MGPNEALEIHGTLKMKLKEKLLENGTDKGTLLRDFSLRERLKGRGEGRERASGRGECTLNTYNLKWESNNESRETAFKISRKFLLA